ncbi:MAG TPA: ABC transporter permease subunit [Acidimicrobiales bacterium]|nr:ABC transporter permease subunit [Acidimicrobiales bacterium]
MRTAGRRKVFTVLFRVGTYLALGIVITPAVWVLVGVVAKAAPGWQWNVLWTPLVSNTGGIEGPLIGTLILMAGVLLIAGTIGVLAGIHLAELSKSVDRGPSSWLRMASDVLSGFPSIVLGYVGYVALVVGLHWGYSLLPALLILSIMVVPYIAKSTETALRQVPSSYREGAEALGMSTGFSLRRVVLKSAAPGIVTGILIALAISAGETAPLIYTANFSQTTWTGSFIGGHEFGYLTYMVFTYWDEPFKHDVQLSYDAAMVLVAIVLILLVSARIIVARTQRHAESRGG